MHFSIEPVMKEFKQEYDALIARVDLKYPHAKEYMLSQRQELEREVNLFRYGISNEMSPPFLTYLKDPNAETFVSDINAMMKDYFQFLANDNLTEATKRLTQFKESYPCGSLGVIRIILGVAIMILAAAVAVAPFILIFALLLMPVLAILVGMASLPIAIGIGFGAVSVLEPDKENVKNHRNNTANNIFNIINPIGAYCNNVSAAVNNGPTDQTHHKPLFGPASPSSTSPASPSSTSTSSADHTMNM